MNYFMRSIPILYKEISWPQKYFMVYKEQPQPLTAATKTISVYIIIFIAILKYIGTVSDIVLFPKRKLICMLHSTHILGHRISIKFILKIHFIRVK